MGETYYTNQNFRYDEERGKWRGFLYHWGADGKRHHKTKTFKATKQRAAHVEYLKWVRQMEEEAQRRQWQGDAANAAELQIPEKSSFAECG